MRCQCEHEKHGDTGCKIEATTLHETDYGTYRVCHECATVPCMPHKTEGRLTR